MLALLLVLCLLAAGATEGRRPRRSRGSTRDQCLRDVGGGPLGPGGIVLPPGGGAAFLERLLTCSGTFVNYYSGQYEFDQRTVRDQGLDYFDSDNFAQDGTELIVFDIDDTSLSTLSTLLPLLSGLGGDSGDALQGAFGQGISFPQVDDLPPLAPIQELFEEVYARGFAVAFISGRGEDYRADTVTNLEAAGFGKPCEMDGTDVIQGEELCYVALELRGADDAGVPSSDYKWRRREKLTQAGFQIVGAIGDQWSDLIGPVTPPAIFKVPNPIYTIA